MTTVTAAEMRAKILSHEEAHALTTYADLPRLRAVADECGATWENLPEALWETPECRALRAAGSEALAAWGKALEVVIESPCTSDAVFAAKLALCAQSIARQDARPANPLHRVASTSTDGMAMQIVRDLISRGRYSSNAIAA